MKRAVLPWGVVSVLGVLASVAYSTPVDEHHIQQLLRVTAIESALGFAVPLDQLLCVDEGQGRRPMPPAGSAGAQLADERMRRLLDVCRLQASESSPIDTMRLVGQVRTEFQARLAKLGPLRAALGKCRDFKEQPRVMTDCFARALGRLPSDEEVAAFSQP